MRLRSNIIRRKGRRVPNALKRFETEKPYAIKQLFNLLRVRIKEVVAIAPDYDLLAAEDGLRGFVFISHGQCPKLVCSYGDPIVPDIAIQRTLDLIFSGNYVEPAKKGRWRKKLQNVL